MTPTCIVPICQRPGDHNGFCRGCFELLTEEEMDQLAISVRLASNTHLVADANQQRLAQIQRIFAKRISERMAGCGDPTRSYKRRLKSWDTRSQKNT